MIYYTGANETTLKNYFFYMAFLKWRFNFPVERPQLSIRENSVSLCKGRSKWNLK
jgi:hypothetical protein